MAVDGGRLAFTIILTAATAIPAIWVGTRASRKLFPQPQRTPAQAAAVRRVKRMLLGYCIGLLVLTGVLWLVTGNVFEAIGITLAIMVVAQFAVGGWVTHKKGQLHKANSGTSP